MHGKYLCLGQAENVHINRLNPDGTIKEARVCGDFGICIHSGGEGMQTDRFSAGCQIIQNPDGYFQEHDLDTLLRPDPRRHESARAGHRALRPHLTRHLAGRRPDLIR